MKPFVCERPSCTKRFWTSQHLRAHQSWHDGAKPYKVSCILCLLIAIILNSPVNSSALKPTVWKNLRSTTSYVLIHVPFMHRQAQSLLYVDIMVVQNPLIQISIYEPTKKFMRVRVTLTFVHTYSVRAHCRQTLYLHSYRLYGWRK
jgi:hypothetical protein